MTAASGGAAAANEGVTAASGGGTAPGDGAGAVERTAWPGAHASRDGVAWFRIARAHTRVTWLQLVRQPGYLVPVVVLPALLYLLFGRAIDHGNHAAVTFAGYCIFAVLSATILQFSAVVAEWRARPWEAFVRSLAPPAAAQGAAHLVSALGLAACSVAAVAVTAAATGGVPLTAGDAGPLAGILLAGTLPSIGLGLTVAYWTPRHAVVAAANLVWLSLAFLGGLLGSIALPHSLARLTQALPTSLWLALVSTSLSTHRVAWAALAGLVTWTAASFVAAALGLRRVEASSR